MYLRRGVESGWAMNDAVEVEPCEQTLRQAAPCGLELCVERGSGERHEDGQSGQTKVDVSEP